MAYSPTPPGGMVRDYESLARWIFQEFSAIAEDLQATREGRLFPILTVAPSKPREAMLAFADGTSWNPGGGAGFYQYVSGAWVKL